MDGRRKSETEKNQTRKVLVKKIITGREKQRKGKRKHWTTGATRVSKEICKERSFSINWNAVSILFLSLRHYDWLLVEGPTSLWVPGAYRTTASLQKDDATILS